MAMRIGVDLIEVSRFEPAQVSQAFLDKVYLAREVEEARGIPRLLAERFALKEAWMKALGCGIEQGVWFSQIEVWLDDGAWQVAFFRRAAAIAEGLGVGNFSASTACSERLVIATVVVLMK